MRCHFPYITLNGRRYDSDEILYHCRKALVLTSKEWERDLYAFILEWLNDKDYVEANTSGSTGEPKRIRLSKKSMISSARMTGQFFKFRPGQKALLCLSPAYIAGKMMMVRAIIWGLDLITVEPGGNPLKDLTDEIDFAAMVPLQVYNSLETSACFEKVKRIIIGGGAVDEGLQDRLANIETECYSTYGMTETVSHVALKKLNRGNTKDSFEALGNTKFSLDDRGCLVINASHLLGDELITNDLVELLSETEFRWLGRYDNVVNSGGVKLILEKLEQKVAHLIKCRFFFAALPDEKLGEKLVLVIEGGEWDEDEIQQFKSGCSVVLKKYEQPKDFVFIRNFSLTPTGKIQRTSTLARL